MKKKCVLKTIYLIKEERENSKLTQAGLADILNVSYGLIGNIESSKYPHRYTLKQLETLCSYFEIPMYSLFLTDEEYNEKKQKTLEILIKKIIDYGTE